MTARATSKLALLGVTVSGQKAKQRQRVLDFILLGGDITLQELMASYEAKWGISIDSGVMAARMNELKHEDNPQVKEAPKRKCSISGRKVTPLTDINTKGYGEWQGWVASGKGKKEQLARFAQVPEEMKPRVQSHMRTVIAIKEAKNGK